MAHNEFGSTVDHLIHCKLYPGEPKHGGHMTIFHQILASIIQEFYVIILPESAKMVGNFGQDISCSLPYCTVGGGGGGTMSTLGDVQYTVVSSTLCNLITKGHN